MNKVELIDAMAEQSKMTKKDTKIALEAFETVVTDALTNGDKVGLVGFGTFELRVRKERKGRNPKTQEEIIIPATKAPAFRFSPKVKDAVNA